MNLDALTPYIIVLMDCVIPGMSAWYPPTEKHIASTSELSSVEVTSNYGETRREVSVTTKEAESEKVTLASGLFGEADALIKNNCIL